MIKTFDEFVRDCNNIWNEQNRVITFRCVNELEEVIYDLYDSWDFDIDYDNETIEIY